MARSLVASVGIDWRSRWYIVLVTRLSISGVKGSLSGRTPLVGVSRSNGMIGMPHVDSVFSMTL